MLKIDNKGAGDIVRLLICRKCRGLYKMDEPVLFLVVNSVCQNPVHMLHHGSGTPHLATRVISNNSMVGQKAVHRCIKCTRLSWSCYKRAEPQQTAITVCLQQDLCTLSKSLKSTNIGI